MFFSYYTSERALAMRLLNASRFHPLLMDRLAKLAVAGAALRPQLLQALDTLEKTRDFTRLPELFATTPGDTKELAYLNDALAASLDQLIQQASPDARRLLWMIAVANEPIELALLQSVWSESASQSDPRPLLRYLTSVGLVTDKRDGPDDDNPTLTCHELVRERIRTRFREHPAERDGLSENDIRLAYADRLAAAFQALQLQNMTAALSAGSRALVYCVQAEAWERLGAFASGVVTSTNDPRLLSGLLPHLEAAAQAAPAGRPRWSCLGNLADALRKGGRPDLSLSFYEQAAAQARAVAESATTERGAARQAWADLGAITGNWANALVDTGNLDAARQRLVESVEARKNAGRPAVDVIGMELEALRIDIMQGRHAEALPQVETRLARIEQWWRQHRTGQSVPEALDPAFLARAYISALDVACDAHFAAQDWEAALPRLDAILAVKRALERPAEDIAVTRMNRANVLGRLGRFGEAQAELEACLQINQHDPVQSQRIRSALADLFAKQGDVTQAIAQERRALVLCEQLPDPSDRAISHNNLAIYLERSGTPAALSESPRHQLAALVYLLVAGLGQDMQNSLHNYGVRFRRAHEAGTPFVVPRVAELLADPAFDPLDQWLRQRQVNVDELQAAADDLLAQVQAAAVQ